MDDAPVELDHVVIGVPDLDVAAARLDRDHGVTAVAGGRHPGWGTANRLVPLGSTYLELVTVVDPGQAAASPFGRWVASMLDGGSSWGWAVRTPRLRALADRLGLEVAEGSRRSASGELLTWLISGVEQAATRPGLPFLIEWGDGTPLPGRAPVQHRAGTVALQGLHLEADPAELAAWLGPHRLPITCTPGSRGLTAVTLAAAGAPIRLAAG